MNRFPMFGPLLMSLTGWSELGGAATGSSDLLLGGGGERVRAHLHSHGDVAGTEDLDRVAAANGALGDQVLHTDRATVGEELVEAVEVDHLELHLERVLEALELRQAHVKGHLATLEA